VTGGRAAAVGVAGDTGFVLHRDRQLSATSRLDEPPDFDRAAVIAPHFCSVHISNEVITMLKKLMLMMVAVTIGSPLLLTGCNTMQGAGRDVEKAGQKVQEEAVEHKKY
jgi:predicted small secreted protein